MRKRLVMKGQVLILPFAAKRDGVFPVQYEQCHSCGVMLETSAGIRKILKENADTYPTCYTCMMRSICKKIEVVVHPLSAKEEEMLRKRVQNG